MAFLDLARPVFGLVIPGLPVAEFSRVSDTKYVLDVPNPGNIVDITFFVGGQFPWPVGYSVALYFSIPPFEQWALIGILSPEKPSAIFHTGWSSNDTIRSSAVARLGASIELTETLDSLDMATSGVEERKQFAHKIALDLFRFMESFQNNSQAGALVVPSNIFDRWLQRFEAKYTRDPNFMLKVD